MEWDEGHHRLQTKEGHNDGGVCEEDQQHKHVFLIGLTPLPFPLPSATTCLPTFFLASRVTVLLHTRLALHLALLPVPPSPAAGPDGISSRVDHQWIFNLSPFFGKHLALSISPRRQLSSGFKITCHKNTRKTHTQPPVHAGGTVVRPHTTCSSVQHQCGGHHHVPSSATGLFPPGNSWKH